MISGQAESFPMLYQWRILHEPLDSPDLAAIIDEVAEIWRGTPEVKARLDAIANAPATVLCFFEFVLATLLDWLEEQVALGIDATDAAIGDVTCSPVCGI